MDATNKEFHTAELDRQRHGLRSLMIEAGTTLPSACPRPSRPL